MEFAYNELEREKYLRIDAQLKLLDFQIRQVSNEQQMLYKSILKRAKIPEEKWRKVVFYPDRVELKEENND